MPRGCTVCLHPDREEIDTLLVEGASIRDVSRQTDVSKSALDRHKRGHLPVAVVAATERDVVEQQQRLFADASTLRRSMQGWGGLRDRADWLEVCEQAESDFQSGRFLLTRLGAERYLDPEQVATLLNLRRQIIADMNLTTAVEFMLLDTAIIAYRNMLMVEEWIGNLALLAEHHLFGDAGPTAKIKRTNGRYSGLAAEDDAKRLRDQLLPAFDRASKTFLTAINALAEYQRKGVSVTIGQAAQVNVGEQQLVVGAVASPS